MRFSAAGPAHIGRLWQSALPRPTATCRTPNEPAVRQGVGRPATESNIGLLYVGDPVAPASALGLAGFMGGCFVRR